MNTKSLKNLQPFPYDLQIRQNREISHSHDYGGVHHYRSRPGDHCLSVNQLKTGTRHYGLKAGSRLTHSVLNKAEVRTTLV